MTNTQQPYDPQKATEAALARTPLEPQRQRFSMILALRILFLAVAVVALGTLVIQSFQIWFEDVGVPPILPDVVILALEGSLATIVIPIVWESTFVRVSSKVWRTVGYVIACAIFFPIGAALIVALIGLLGVLTGRD